MLDWAETSYLNRFSVVINWKQKETNDESKPFNRNHSNICYDKSRQSYFFNKGDDSPLTPANFLCPWDYNNQNNILSCENMSLSDKRNDSSKQFKEDKCKVKGTKGFGLKAKKAAHKISKLFYLYFLIKLQIKFDLNLSLKT